MITKLREFVRRLVRPSVDDCIGFAVKAIDNLEVVALRHSAEADCKRDFARKLFDEADDHDAEYVRALRVQSKLHDLFN
jgi:hypothetical protein